MVWEPQFKLEGDPGVGESLGKSVDREFSRGTLTMQYLHSITTIPLQDKRQGWIPVRL